MKPNKLARRGRCECASNSRWHQVNALSHVVCAFRASSRGDWISTVTCWKSDEYTATHTQAGKFVQHLLSRFQTLDTFVGLNQKNAPKTNFHYWFVDGASCIEFQLSHDHPLSIPTSRNLGINPRWWPGHCWHCSFLIAKDSHTQPLQDRAFRCWDGSRAPQLRPLPGWSQGLLASEPNPARGSWCFACAEKTRCKSRDKTIRSLVLQME